MATTSLGSSTTQMTVRSRRGSRQTRHSSCSLTLPQIRQKRTLSFTSVSAETSRRTSTGSAESRWKAMRWALFGPTPGRRPSSSIRSWTAPSYTVLQPREPEPAATAEATRERAHRGGGAGVGLALGVPDRRDDEVLQRLDVLGVDGVLRDGERGQLAAAGHRGGDQPAAGRAGHLGARQLLLGGDQLLLHLL